MLKTILVRVLEKYYLRNSVRQQSFRFTVNVIINFILFCPAQGLVRGVRRERQADILVHVRSPIRQLSTVRSRPVLRMGQGQKSL